MNHTPQKSTVSSPLKVISQMMRRVYQQDELSQYSMSNDNWNQSVAYKNNSAKKEDQKGFIQDSSKKKGTLEEMQDVQSFQEPLGSDKKSLITTDLATQFFNLPQEALRKIIAFLLQDYRNLNLVSAKWYVGVHQILNEWLEEVDNKYEFILNGRFLKSNISILTIKNSFLSFTPFKSNNRQSFRLDRCIVAEVLPGCEGKTITLGFTYRKCGSTDYYQSEFKYDVYGRRESRQIWLLKEEAKHNYDSENITQTCHVAQVCSEDNIRFAVNFFNMGGFVDLDSIQWLQPVIEPLQKELQLIKAKKNPRICYLEKAFHDWILYEYFPNELHRKKLTDLSPQLIIKETRCAGIDTVANRMILIADQKGTQNLGIPVQIIGHNEEMTVEVKKYGLIADLQLPVQLRKGDQLTYYLTRGD